MKPDAAVGSKLNSVSHSVRVKAGHVSTNILKNSLQLGSTGYWGGESCHGFFCFVAKSK